jgi:hypothetical protein
MMASGRSTGWRQTNRAPSATSSRSRVDPAGPAPAARKLPASRARQAAPDQVGGRGHAHGDGQAEGGQQAPEGWADEGVGHQLDREQPAVGTGQVVAGHDGREQGLGRGVEQGLGEPEQHGHGVQHRQGGQVGRDGQGQAPEQHGPDQVDPDHRLAAVQPVGQGPGHRRQQPREPGGDGDPGDQHRRPGELHGQQGQGDPEDPVGQVGEARGHHGLLEVPSEGHVMGR